MAGEPTPTTTTTPAPAAAAPPAAASPAPAAEAPAPAPAAPETPAPAPDAPAADAPPAAEASKAEAAKAPGSLLGDAGKEPVAPAEAPKEPTAPAEGEAPKPVYAALTLPEGVTLDDSQVNVFTDMVADFELTTKADHAAVEGFRQKLADFYVDETRRQLQAQAEMWNRTREGWRNDFIADKEIGGNRQQTTLSRCGAMIEQYGGTPVQKKELREALAVTGTGDHPALIRFINNMARVLSEGKPVPAVVPKSPVTKSKASRRYQNGGLNS
jgi:hypothetical protein